jgi:hypothetical protein
MLSALGTFLNDFFFRSLFSIRSLILAAAFTSPLLYAAAALAKPFALADLAGAEYF